MLNAIKSLYKDVESAVRINGTMTEWFPVSDGLKEGCLLSPSLFAVYINDLAKEIERLQCGINVGDDQISILMFADDIALVSDSEEKMQQMLDCLYEWCYKWRVTLNMDKTKVVHFRSNSVDRTDTEFRYGNSTVEITDKYKYLGLWMNEFLEPMASVKALAASAGRALGALITKCKTAGGVSYHIYTKLYNSLVAPVLNYAAGIWGTAMYSCINTIQNRACRYYLGVGSKSANVATRADMGWMSQPHRQYIEVLRLYCRLQQLPQERSITRMHQLCMNLRYSTIWEHKAKRLFKNVGFALPDGDFSDNAIMRDFKVYLLAKDQEEWYTDLWNDKNCQNGNKLRVYRLHKSRLECEQYVQNVPRYERITLARLRCGSLPLNVELGRYRDAPLETRICEHCDTHSIEDEIHFMIDCPFYNDLRQPLLTSLSTRHEDFVHLPSLAKYCLVMNDSCIMRRLAITVDRMFKRRQSFM